MRVFGLSLTTKCSLVQFREEVSAEKKTPNGSVCACSSVCECVCVRIGYSKLYHHSPRLRHGGLHLINTHPHTVPQ